MLSLRIAARFLRTSPAQSGLIITGIAVGIALQIFVGSLITSLQTSLVDTTIGSAPQITVQNPTIGDPVRFTPQVESVMTTDSRVKPGTVVPVRITNSLFTQGSDTAPLNLIGGDLKELDGIYKITERTTDGQPSLGTNQVMVGTDFAEKYGVAPGDTVQLTFQGDRAADFRVSGVFDLGSAAFNERSAFVNGAVPQDILGYSNDEYTAIYAQANDPFEAAAIAADWRRRIPDDEILDWQAQNADLLTGLQSQTSSSILIQSFVLIAVALGIASTLAISAVQKTRQIGILKAMGMRDRPSGLIFLYEALMLGGIGSLSGVLLAFLLIWLFSFAPLTFTVVPEPGFVLISASIGIAVAIASAIIPSRNTSKLDPIEVIQGG